LNPNGKGTADNWVTSRQYLGNKIQIKDFYRKSLLRSSSRFQQ